MSINNKELLINTIPLGDDEYLFKTNYTIEGEEVEFDTINIKRILETQPIKTQETTKNGEIHIIDFDLSYVSSKNVFELSMRILNIESQAQEILQVETIKLEQMFQMLLDSYNNSTYLTSHELLSSKVDSMNNVLNANLLNQKIFPTKTFLVEGEGKIYSSNMNQVIGIFDRAVINPETDSVLICEYVGSIIREYDVDFVMKTTLGVEIKFNNINFIEIEDANIYGIQYALLEYQTPSTSLAYESNLELIEEKIEYKQAIKTTGSNILTDNTNVNGKIKSAIKDLDRKNTYEELIQYVRDKKDILYKDEVMNDLESIADEIFDDLDF